MISFIEETIIRNAFMNMITKGEFPDFGSPECRCNKCMFHNVMCKPKDDSVVGCYHGWKREKDNLKFSFYKEVNKYV